MFSEAPTGKREAGKGETEVSCCCRWSEGRNDVKTREKKTTSGMGRRMKRKKHRKQKDNQQTRRNTTLVFKASTRRRCSCCELPPVSFAPNGKNTMSSPFWPWILDERKWLRREASRVKQRLSRLRLGREQNVRRHYWN